jgi:hypothetical protein
MKSKLEIKKYITKITDECVFNSLEKVKQTIEKYKESVE